MKKLKNLFPVALVLGLFMTGCDGGEEGPVIPDDNRSKVVGVYPVKVTVPMVGDIYTDLTLTAEGETDLKASAVAEVPMIGPMTIEVVLSDLKGYTDEAGQTVTGYLFKIAEQELDIMGMPMQLKGKGTYAEGYDGKVYKGAEEAFISLEIGDANISVKVETGLPGEVVTDNRDKVVGTYPVTVKASVLPIPLAADLELTKEGDADLKASASVEVPGMGTMDIELVLSEIKEYNDDNGTAVTGYFFMIAEQELSIMGQPKTMSGTGIYPQECDGKVYVSVSESFISLEISDETGNITVGVESGQSTAFEDYREELTGTYPVSIGLGMLGTYDADLELTAEGLTDMKASAAVMVPGFTEPINIEFVLSGLVVNGDKSGYYFNINSQEFMFGETPMAMSGTDAYEGGTDGEVYNNGSESFISFEIDDDATGGVTVKVESANS